MTTRARAPAAAVRHGAVGVGVGRTRPQTPLQGTRSSTPPLLIAARLAPPGAAAECQRPLLPSARPRGALLPTQTSQLPLPPAGPPAPPPSEHSAIEYKYVVRNPDGNAATWKPGSNYRLSLSSLLPVLASTAQRALGAVGVRDSWCARGPRRRRARRRRPCRVAAGANKRA